MAQDAGAVQARERREIIARCERFLSGHGPLRPRAVLAALAESVGDGEEEDVYGSGALIEEFEQEIAALLGKEAALFLPSGTMAQQIALRIHTERRHCATVAYHPTCHLEIHEEKAYQALHGLRARLVGDPNVLLTLEDLRQVKEPIGALLVELPQREIGGLLPAWDDLLTQVEWARSRGAAVHMDGARLWECGPFYNRSYAEIAAPFDTVYVSFYKGMGAIAGSALVGPADLIAEARVWQRRHGGNLVHLYPYVLSARLGLRQRLGRFGDYYQQALRVGRVLREIPGVVIKPDPPQTRMMHVFLPGEVVALEASALAIAREERVLLFNHPRPAALPGYVVCELSAGDATEELSDLKIEGLFRQLLAV